MNYVFDEPLARNGLFLLSGVMSQYLKSKKHYQEYLQRLDDSYREESFK
jgi:hypothetical protein